MREETVANGCAGVRVEVGFVDDGEGAVGGVGELVGRFCIDKRRDGGKGITVGIRRRRGWPRVCFRLVTSATASKQRKGAAPTTTTEFLHPSTAGSILKQNKCWCPGASTPGATTAPHSLVSPTPTGTVDTNPVAPTTYVSAASCPSTKANMYS